MVTKRQCEGSVLTEDTWETGPIYDQCEQIATTWVQGVDEILWLCEAHYADEDRQRTRAMQVRVEGPRRVIDPDAPF